MSVSLTDRRKARADNTASMRSGSATVATLPRAQTTEARPAGRQVVVRGRWAGRVGNGLLLLAVALFGLLIALPVFAILARALLGGEVLAAIGRPVVVEALRLSLLTTALTVAVTLVLGTPVAWLLARRSFPGRSLLDGLIELPMVLPPAVAGIGLLMAFGRRGLLGPALASVGITVGFTTVAVVLAQVFVAAPFYVRTARVAFQTTDRDLEEMAATLGASGWATFWQVIVPLTFPALLTGLAMCWARALGEFGATIMFAGSFQGRTQTMPLAIYAALESDLDATLAISAILVVASFGLLWLVRLAARRSGLTDG
jgi:molybdate transport system permease protein